MKKYIVFSRCDGHESGGESENEEDTDEVTLDKTNSMPAIPTERLIRTKTHPKSQQSKVRNTHIFT